jgi:BirA family transcriptional regulator, biotin operon repressor / biotin---[acetyl-CoA-carboxylase] ligase
MAKIECADALPADWAEALSAAAPRLGSLAGRVLYYQTIGSTNDIASALAAESTTVPSAAVVVAEMQTSGRGRRGRSWFSPPGSGLYVSVVLPIGRDHVDGDRSVALVTLAAGVALVEGISAATGLRAELKWPNDLLVGRRKLAGILAEGVINGGRVACVVLGYGVNVAPSSYPQEIADRATSIESELGRPGDRATIFVETLAALASRYADLAHGRFDAILDAWRGHAPSSQGTRITWESANGVTTGVTQGIDATGALIVRVGERTERITAGEVHLLGGRT